MSDNRIVRFFKDIGSDLTNLNSEKANRVRGVLWITAAAIAVVGGLVLSALGVALLYGASVVAKGTIAGVPIGILMVGVGLPLMLSGVPIGIWIASKFVAKGWADLTGKKVDK